MKDSYIWMIIILVAFIALGGILVVSADSSSDGVSSLGEYGQSSTYVNNVKLEEGNGVTITSSDANNSLILALGNTTSLVFEGGTYDTTLSPGTPTASVTYILPLDDGTDGQFLSTNGSGTLSWQTSAGSGDITAVGDGANGDVFTADGGGTTLYFEGASADAYEVILTSDDPSGSDFTATLSDHTGYLTVDATECWDVEGTGLSITTGVLNWSAALNDLSDLNAGAPNDQDVLTWDNGTSKWISSAAGSGDITDVGDSSTGAAFTADGTGYNLWFEGSSADEWEIILTSADPSGADFTITLPATTGNVITSGDTGTVTNTMLSGSIDVSDKINLTAGDHITLTDDDLDVDDDFLLNSGDVGTGDYDFTGAILLGATPLQFEGNTDDVYQLNIAVTDITSSTKTITFPNITGTVVTTGDTGTVTNTMLAGSIDIGDKTNLTAGDHITLTDDDLDVDDDFLLNSGDTGTGDYDFTAAFIMGASPLQFEGNTDDAYQTIFAITDPTSSSKTITFPNATGEVSLLGQSIDVSDETNLTAGDHITLTDDDLDIDDDFLLNTGDTGTGDYDFTAAYLLGASPVMFEGNTDDDYQLIVAVTDITSSDKTVTFQDATGVVVLDATACTDLEGTGLSITTGTLNWGGTEGEGIDLSGATISGEDASTTNKGIASFNTSDFSVSSGAVSLQRQRNFILTAAGMWTSTTSGCADNTKVEYGTNDVDLYHLDFDASSDESCQVTAVMPDDYNAGTITAVFYWTTTGSGVDETVIWGLQGRCYANDEAIDQAFGDPQSVSDDWIADGDVHVTSATSAITLGGTPAAAELVQFKIYRDADNGSDDMTVDARLIMVKVVYTGK